MACDNLVTKQNTYAYHNMTLFYLTHFVEYQHTQIYKARTYQVYKSINIA